MPVTLINPFAIAPDAETEFVDGWRRTAAVFAGKPGYLDTRLHQSLDPQARFRFVNVAHWDSAAAWAEAMKAFPPAEGATHGVEANPALYTLATGGAVPAQGHAVEATIKGLEEELAGAYRAGDVAALHRLLSEDYLVTDGPGTTSDKAKVLADHETKRLQVADFRFDEMRVQLVGAEAAIATGQFTWQATYGGHPIPGGTFRYLRVYVRAGDGWHIKVGQVTPVLPKR